MATNSSTLAWKIPWTEEPGGLQSMGLLRVRLSDFTFTFHFCALEWSCLENPRDGGAWWAAVYGAAQSQTQLKRLSSSNSIMTFIILKFYILVQSNLHNYFMDCYFCILGNSSLSSLRYNLLSFLLVLLLTFSPLTQMKLLLWVI